MTLDRIKTAYPNEWVLVGIENIEESDLLVGKVLLHGKDYLELCYKSSELSKNTLTTIIYTGQQSQNRKWLKATRLKEKPTMI